MDFIIENAKVVVPNGIIQNASVKVENGIIVEIRDGEIKSNNKKKINIKGGFLLPGFIDLHCDAIEKEIEPRPNCNFPEKIAIFELDKKLAACGITTIYHSISFAEGEIGLRSNLKASQLIKTINQLSQKLMVKTRIHARYELTNESAVSYLEPLIKKGYIHLLSIMDHTPGQGQFKEVASFKEYFSKVYKMSEEELSEIINRKLSVRNSSYVNLNLRYVMELCRSMNIPLASHDDDSNEKILWLKEEGIGISEFPINMEVARTAHENGIYVCLGAPNVLMGRSQTGNLSALEAISSGYGDIICSDYSPMTILHAVFKLYFHNILPLNVAVNMATLNPAKATGICDTTGSIEEGKDADMIAVNVDEGVPRVIKTFVSGKEVFSTQLV